jgi:hypothetical protein
VGGYCEACALIAVRGPRPIVRLRLRSISESSPLHVTTSNTARHHIQHCTSPHPTLHVTTSNTARHHIQHCTMATNPSTQLRYGQTAHEGGRGCCLLSLWDRQRTRVAEAAACSACDYYGSARTLGQLMTHQRPCCCTHAPR